ncbi:hypothetical protein C2G38_2140502 [Gigaspora rosea]|uniref:Uncharacterized protein n=1 Tax=Gigaspora rosea TaxID=44941 RepID=A0A397VL79_9GLOM|nr:hypothetical protein C2G38_2140502 [Gigaspora rosea]
MAKYFIIHIEPINNFLFRFSLRFMSKYKRAIVKHIKLIVKKRFHKKKIRRYLGCSSICITVFIKQSRNSSNCNLIADIIGIFFLVAMSSTSNRASYALYELAKKKEYWQELYQEAQEINKQYNRNFKSCDNIKW